MPCGLGYHRMEVIYQYAARSPSASMALSEYCPWPHPGRRFLWHGKGPKYPPGVADDDKIIVQCEIVCIEVVDPTKLELPDKTFGRFFIVSLVA